MNNHENNFLSISCGIFLSIIGYFTDHPVLIHTGEQLLKVIFFGMLGGAFGYFGKLIAIKIHRFFKD
jgi:hypothetical protein